MNVYIAPSHDDSAESAVLGAMIKDNTRIPLVRKIIPTPELFFNEKHKVIAEVVFRMHDAGAPVDTVTLSHQLKQEGKLDQAGGWTVAVDLATGCPSPVNCEYYAKIVSEHATDRQLQQAIEACQRDTQDRTGTIDERLQQHLERLSLIQASRIRTGEFPEPVCITKLPPTAGTQWVMEDFIARGMVTLFVALWKSGKTTWESILLRHMGQQSPSEFCGKVVSPGKALVLTEEPSFLWERRREHQPIEENVFILGRDLLNAITNESWPRLCKHLAAIAKRDGISLVVIDPMSSFWPVKDENDNAMVAQVFLALREITKAGVAVLLLHHPAKSDAGVGKLSRGASSLAGAADICIEMRRENDHVLSDRRRKIDWYGRLGYGQVIIELSEDERHYEVLGSPQQLAKDDRLTLIEGLLPQVAPGITPEQLKEVWPEKRKPRIQDLRDILTNFSDAQNVYPAKWHRVGSGIRGNPFRYWIG